MEDKNFYSIDEIAHYLGVSRETIARDVRNKVVPSMKIGRMYRIAKGDVEDYFQKLREHKQQNRA